MAIFKDKTHDSELGQSVYMTELYDILQLDKSQYSRFVKTNIIKNAYCEYGKDYSTFMSNEKKAGRFRQEYHIHIDFAKKLCMVAKTEVGEAVRNELVEVTKKIENRKLVGTKEAALIHTFLNTFKFAQYQIEAESLHKRKFVLTSKTKKDIHKLFAQHRNDILSINNEQLKSAMVEAFNQGLIHTHTAKNIRARIAYTDKYQLLRNAVADYLLSEGVETSDAINFSDTVKEVAQFAKLEIRIKDEDTLFEEKENAAKPLEINVKKLLNP